MPTPTYIPIATTTLASATYSASFSGITQSYRDLVLVLSGKCDVNAATLQMILNNNTGYNYYTVVFDQGPSSYQDEGNYMRIGTAGWWTNQQATMIATLNDYSTTDRTKQVLVRYGSGTTKMGFTLGHYNQSAAISTVTVRTDYNAAGWLMAAGTTLTLYGIAG